VRLPPAAAAEVVSPAPPAPRRGAGLLATLLVATLVAPPATAGDDFEQAPIRYSATAPDNTVSRLQERLDAGTETLAWKEGTGWLASVLAALEVPVSSQTLVFSKTSLQQARIGPRNPRALYFNDDVYVGYVRGGDVVELSVADPLLGTVFYTLDQAPSPAPRFARRTEDCLLCHGGSQTRGVPGHVIRSVYPAASGQPIFSAGSHRVDDATPLADRWGGWYVTGRHGGQRHLGNVTYAARPADAAAIDPAGQNVDDLGGRFGDSGYLAAASDLVALSVLAHQASAHNVLTRAGFDVRTALHREAALNRDLGQPASQRWPSTDTVLDASAAALVDCFLFRHEAPLTEGIEGTTGFAAEFAAHAPRDAAGRSLKDLDLSRRLLRHPCSHLVHSASFAALPPELHERFWARMDAVLAPGAPAEGFAHLSADDRRAIRGILAATVPGAPQAWRADAAPGAE